MAGVSFEAVAKTYDGAAAPVVRPPSAPVRGNVWLLLLGVGIAATIFRGAYEQIGKKGWIMCHLSHSYHSGACLYFTFAFVPVPGRAEISVEPQRGHTLAGDGVAESDASHAWAEVFLDGLGWVGFDVSNGISPDNRYIRVATGFDYADAAPITGLSYGARDESMVVSLRVEQ